MVMEPLRWVSVDRGNWRVTHKSSGTHFVRHTPNGIIVGIAPFVKGPGSPTTDSALGVFTAIRGSGARLRAGCDRSVAGSICEGVLIIGSLGRARGKLTNRRISVLRRAPKRDRC